MLTADSLENEKDAPPVGLFHLRKILSRKPYPAEKIGFDDLRPILVGKILEGLGFINTEVIDENVHCRKSSRRLFRRFGCCKVGHERFHLRPRIPFENSRNGTMNTLFGAAVDNYARAFSRESRGDGKSNSRARSSDQGDFVFEVKIHVSFVPQTVCGSSLHLENKVTLITRSEAPELDLPWPRDSRLKARA